jgi:hypothetical protein
MDWQVTPDPVRTAWSLPPGAEPHIRDAEVSAFQRLFTPIESPYAAIFEDNLGKQNVAVYDIRDGNVLGEWKPEGMRGFVALAPDAGRLALLRREPHEAVIWDVASGEQIATWSCTGPVAEIAFFDPHRFLYIAARQSEAQIVRAEDGQELLSFDLGFQAEMNSVLRLSPGGRYLVAVVPPEEEWQEDPVSGEKRLVPESQRRTEWGIEFFDLDEGQSRGLLPVRDSQRRAPFAIAISDDGEQMAAWLGAGPFGQPPSRLDCWDVSTGQILHQLEVSEGEDQRDKQKRQRIANAYRGPALQFVSDGSGWLLHGHVFLDREGNIAWEVPFNTFGGPTGPHRFLDPQRLLLVQPQETLSERILFEVHRWRGKPSM